MRVREREFAVIAALVFILLMNYVERTIAPAYWLKSLVKVSVILLILISYSAVCIFRRKSTTCTDFQHQLHGVLAPRSRTSAPPYDSTDMFHSLL